MPWLSLLTDQRLCSNQCWPQWMMTMDIGDAIADQPNPSTYIRYDDALFLSFSERFISPHASVNNYRLQTSLVCSGFCAELQQIKYMNYLKPHLYLYLYLSFSGKQPILQFIPQTISALSPTACAAVEGRAVNVESHLHDAYGGGCLFLWGFFLP